ncbi:MAG: hypothetical protein JO186_02225, partial [Actinobacteria bacterium]|nr:hypothetical protein [Actinomycetota bacterium]
FRAIPGRLVQQLPEGPWIKLYGFNKAVVLNAQLQTIVSLGEYAGAAEDSAASALASQLEQTTLTDLPRFDSGYWTYYQLPHTFSPLDYQQFVVSLLQKLAPQNPAFGAAATRFDGYDTQPPAFRLGDSAPGTVKLWLSKPASLLVDALGASKRVSLGFGWHTLSWKLPKTAGIWAVHIAATDWAGNTASLDALPLVRVSDVVAGRRASTRVATPASLAQPSFTVGVQLPDPTKAPLAAREHLTTLQVGVQWLGESSPDPAVVASLQQLAAKSRLVVELQPQQLPSDDSGRAALAADVTTLVQQVPGIQDVLLGPVPAPAAAKTYLEALGAIDDAVKPAAPTVRVGAEVDGNTAPQTLLNTYARDIRNEGWTTPPFDELAVRPAAVSAAGVWAVGDYAKLVAAATKAFGTAVPVLWDGVTALPGLADADQATAYTTLLQTASCQPQTEGVLFATLVDGSDTTGFYASDGTAKASATTLKPVLASAARGSLVACPGLSTPATTSALTFPSDLSSGVQVGCVRDCLYLLTLDDPTGTPVLAARGALTGGAAPATVQLPAATVPPGTYTLTLRLVTQSNPGPVTVQQSAPITTG